MVRVTLGGEELRGFVSLGYDDHVKVFFPPPGQQRPALPASPATATGAALGTPGPQFSDSVVSSAKRDYTPRRYDPQANTLQIEFVLHGEGPASIWADQAAPGQYLGIGGPRGSFVVPDEFDWYLLIGDETALPAIGRRLEELRSDTQALVIVEVADAHEEQALQSRAHLQLTWLHRDGAQPGCTDLLPRALAAAYWPTGRGYAWAAGESSTARALRQQLLERGLPKQWVKAAGYWKLGAAAVHETYSE